MPLLGARPGSPLRLHPSDVVSYQPGGEPGLRTLTLYWPAAVPGTRAWLLGVHAVGRAGEL